MSLSASQLAKVAQLRGADSTTIEKLIGEKYAERFGDAFLEVLEST
jgi:ATP-dependent DNA helicase RecQ